MQSSYMLWLRQIFRYLNDGERNYHRIWSFGVTKVTSEFWHWWWRWHFTTQMLFSSYMTFMVAWRLTGTPLTLSTDFERSHLSVPMNTHYTFKIRFVFSSWNYCRWRMEIISNVLWNVSDDLSSETLVLVNNVYAYLGLVSFLLLFNGKFAKVMRQQLQFGDVVVSIIN